jgi:glycerol-3-phosphate dehydrogenase
VLTIVGGKLTTYRKMAQDAVDATGLAAGPCRTRDLPLVGAGTSTVDIPVRLRLRYGTEAATVAALAAVDPDLAEPVAPGASVTAAEVVWAVRHEGALDADDVLHRRTRIGLVPAEAEAARPAVTELVAKALAGVVQAC